MNETFYMLKALAQKYGLTDLERKFDSRIKNLNSKTYTSGIIGDAFFVPKCLRKFIPSLEKYIPDSNRSFYFTISKGDKEIFEEIDARGTGGSRILSFEDLKEMLLQEPSLENFDEVLPPIYGKIFVVDDKMSACKFVAVASMQGFEEFDLSEFLLDIDSCNLLLSAQRLLSGAEKKLINNVLQNKKRNYLLTDLKYLGESDKEKVLDALKSFDEDGEIISIDSDDDCKNLLQAWQKESKNTKALTKIREAAISNYVKDKIMNHLTESKKVSALSEEELSSMMKKLSGISSRLSSKADRTIGYLELTFLEPLKVSVQGNLNEFHGKLQSDLLEGVDEENDVSKLREALPYYVNGSWYEFLEELNEKIFVKLFEANNSLQEDIAQNVESSLAQVLTEDEYNEIHDMILDALYKKTQSEDEISTRGGSDYTIYPIVAKEKKSLYKALPAALGGLGGIMLFSGALIPTVLLGIAAYKAHGKLVGEQKKVLLEQGLKLSNECYLNANTAMNENFSKIDGQLSAFVNESYDRVIEYILKILEDNQQKHNEALSKISEIQSDRAALEAL